MRLGLLYIVSALVLARIAVYFAHPAPGATPQQIWYSMPPLLKALTIGGYVLFAYGFGVLINGVSKRLRASKTSQ